MPGDSLVVPSQLMWMVEQTINIITLCDDCHKLFDDKAALWVSVDESASDPARRLKIRLQPRIPNSIPELIHKCKEKFKVGVDHFVRVPTNLNELEQFPCWLPYDVLWKWRLRWSQAKYEVLCKKEDEQRSSTRPKNAITNAPSSSSSSSSASSIESTGGIVGHLESLSISHALSTNSVKTNQAKVKGKHNETKSKEPREG